MNALFFKLLTTTSNDSESSFVRDQADRNSQAKSDEAAAERGHMYMMIQISNIFGYVNDLKRLLLVYDLN